MGLSRGVQPHLLRRRHSLVFRHCSIYYGTFVTVSTDGGSGPSVYPYLYRHLSSLSISKQFLPDLGVCGQISLILRPWHLYCSQGFSADSLFLTQQGSFYSLHHLSDLCMRHILVPTDIESKPRSHAVDDGGAPHALARGPFFLEQNSICCPIGVFQIIKCVWYDHP